MLNFFGRGSAFADFHNSAYFEYENDLIIIDCPVTTFQKVKRMDLKKYRNLYVLITHTHGDHSGGVGTMLQYTWFVLNKALTIVSPSEDVKSDLLTLLMRIEGCEENWFHMVSADELHTQWLISAIPTSHAASLEGKCFGYHLKVGGNDVIYTGDTKTLEPYLPLLQDGVYFYCEAAFHKSSVHLQINEILPVLEKIVSAGVSVYLMHLDDEERIMQMIEHSSIMLVPIK